MLGVGLTLAVALSPKDEFAYTLSQPMEAARSENVYRVVFVEDASELAIRQLLTSIDAEIIAGPSPKGVYSIRTLARPRAPSVVLEALRVNPIVRFAEPLLIGTTAE